MGNCQTNICCTNQQTEEQISNLNGKDNTKPTESLPNLQDYREIEEQKIIKIQAQVRGGIVRRQNDITQQSQQSKRNSNQISLNDISTGPPAQKNTTPLLNSEYFKNSIKPKDEQFLSEISNSQKEQIFIGRLELNNGTFYEGEWFKGLKNGKGKLEFSECVYEGDWVENRAEGQGKLIHLRKNGQVELYQGEFQNDRANGNGKYTTKNYEYEGQWVEDLYEGQGQLEIFGVSKYIGAFKMGMRHGMGTLEQYQQNTKYVGEFVYDKISGKGEYTQNGNIYKGTWAQNKMQGKFEIQYQNGSILKGNYENDIKQGQFILSNQDQVWEGEYKDGLIHGTVQIKKNDNVRLASWDKGKFVRWEKN